MTAPRLSIVVAMGDNRVIGADGAMPWRLPSDLKQFRRITMGKPIIMGRRTLESIGKPLPGRDNLILSRDPAYRPEGARVFTDLDAALAEAERLVDGREDPEIIIGGGGTIYAATLDRVDRLYVTHVAASPDGDTVFPSIDPAVWRLAGSEPMVRTEKDSADAVFAVYERIRPDR